MEFKYGFTLLEPDEFDNWIKSQNVARTVLYIQEHHTFVPAYEHFTGANHFELQRGMQNVHKAINGWVDIGQHFSIFPDGRIVTGRSLERSPACIFGFNAYSICIENIGNFDKDGDIMRQEQRASIVAVTASLAKRFNIPVDTDRIVYHHWFDLNSGIRKNGDGITKTCPGTGFFGGNKVPDAQANFIPLVKSALQSPTGLPLLNILFYGSVTASTLNIRRGPGTSFSKINVTEFGSVLRIYEIRNGWYRIAANRQEWVFGGYVQRVERGTVNTGTLNVRTGPGTQFRKVGGVFKNQELFVFETQNSWIRISHDQLWVSRNFITFA